MINQVDLKLDARDGGWSPQCGDFNRVKNEVDREAAHYLAALSIR
jgi:hypothetical protein